MKSNNARVTVGIFHAIKSSNHIQPSAFIFLVAKPWNAEPRLPLQIGYTILEVVLNFMNAHSELEFSAKG